RYSFWPSSHKRRRTTPEVLWEGFQPRQALPGRPGGAEFPPDVATVAELPDLHALVRRQVQLLAFLPHTTEDNSRSPVGGVSTPTGLARKACRSRIPAGRRYRRGATRSSRAGPASGTASGLPPTNDGGQLPKSCGRGFNPDRPC